MEESLEQLCKDLDSFRVKFSDFKIEKTIALGGYGKVYLAQYTPKNIRCALKELYIDELKGRKEQLFVREVKILAMADNYFLLPFIGFSAEKPYSIATEFIPNGNLYDALHTKELKKDLSGTEKTIIAMGIAMGMSRLHSLNIIHRDLKSLNILLDAKNYPKICDFGISRFQMQEDNEVITQQIGTPHWMAPEMFEGIPYTGKVDVYAYGILLWELLTRQMPFKGMTPIQIMNAICEEKQRPSIPKGTPESLSLLINLCWAQDPEYRPPFDKIAQLFVDHRVAFPDTKPEVIDNVIAELNANEAPLETKALNFNNTTNEGEKKALTASTVPTTSTLFAILKSGDPTLIDQQARLITPDNCTLFFDAIWKLYSVGAPNDTIKTTLIAVMKIIVTNYFCLKHFVCSNLHLSLPFNDPEIIPLSLSILLPVFEKFPHSVPASLIKTVRGQVKAFPLKVLRLFAAIALNFDNAESKWQVGDTLIVHADDFLRSNAAIPFLQTLRGLIKSSKDFRQARLEGCTAIFAKCLSKSKELCKEAFFDLISIVPDSFQVDPDVLAGHLKNTNREFAVNLIAVSTPKTINEELITALTSSPGELVVPALLRLAKYHGAMMTKCCMMWGACGSDQDLTRIVLTLIANKEIRNDIVNIPFLPALMSRLIQTGDLNNAAIVRTMLKVLKLTEEFASQLERNAFVKSVISAATTLNTTESILNCFIILDRFLRVKYSEDALQFIPHALASLRMTKELRKPALSFFAILASFPQSQEAVKNCGVTNAIAEVERELSDDAKPLVEAVSKNISISL